MKLEEKIAKAQKDADNGYAFSAFFQMKNIIKEHFPHVVDWGEVERLSMLQP